MLYVNPAKITAIGAERLAIDRVVNLPTLWELSADDVRLGFWVGQMLGVSILPELCAILEVRTCSGVTPPPLPDVSQR